MIFAVVAATFGNTPPSGVAIAVEKLMPLVAFTNACDHSTRLSSERSSDSDGPDVEDRALRGDQLIDPTQLIQRLVSCSRRERRDDGIHRHSNGLHFIARGLEGSLRAREEMRPPLPLAPVPDAGVSSTPAVMVRTRTGFKLDAATESLTFDRDKPAAPTNQKMSRREGMTSISFVIQ